MAEQRRFFFDDGSSRKRWHIQQRGKQQIVHVGRLGRTLKESATSFPSPAEARQSVEKLIARKQREGYIEIDPSRLEISAKGRKRATEKQIATFEKRLGSPLPGEYRQFLLTTNGGRPNPDCVAVPGVEGIDNVGVGTLFHLQPAKAAAEELGYELENAGKLLPDGHLPIAGSSDLFTLSLKPETHGCVFWWFHETEEVDDEGSYLESAGYLLAGSFDEFLTRIAGLFGNEEEIAAETPPVAKPAAGKTGKASLKKLIRLVNHTLTEEKVREIQQVIQELGDVSGIQNGEWPFNNLDSPAVVRSLLQAGLNPEILDTAGHSLLWQCAGSPECVDLLLERGGKVNRRNAGDLETPLMRAIYLESLPSVEKLLKAGANPRVSLDWPFQDKLDRSAKLRDVIDKARVAWKKRKSAPQKSRPAPPAKTAAAGKTKGPKPTLARLLGLLKHDMIPDEFEERAEIEALVGELGDLSGIADGDWPKIDRFESPDLLRSLLDAGLNPEIVDKGGHTLLYQCATSPDCLDLLLGRGVAVDRRGSATDDTPLIRASLVGDEQCTRTLLEAGADPTAELTPFAKVLLGMNKKKTAFLDQARAEWHQKRSKTK